VTALYVPMTSDVTPEAIKAELDSSLSRFKHPKYWIVMENLPHNAQGKLDQSHLNRIASEYISKHPNS
jgi:o-succinylbenzoate---CoA ligase